MSLPPQLSTPPHNATPHSFLLLSSLLFPSFLSSSLIIPGFPPSLLLHTLTPHLFPFSLPPLPFLSSSFCSHSYFPFIIIMYMYLASFLPSSFSLSFLFLSQSLSLPSSHIIPGFFPSFIFLSFFPLPLSFPSPIITPGFSPFSHTPPLALVKKLISEIDQDLYQFFERSECHDYLFCHRWLLLDFKREFNFEDS